MLILTVPPDQELTAAQIVILRQTMNKIRETVHRIASEHRDLHSTVSKVGKAIDRVSVFIVFVLMLSVAFTSIIPCTSTSQLSCCWLRLLRSAYEVIVSYYVHMTVVVNERVHDRNYFPS